MAPVLNADKHTVYEFGEFRLEPRRRLLVRAGTRVPLTGKAFDALVHLVEHAGELVTRAALTDALWPSAVVEDNNLTQAIATLRRTLGEDAVATVARRGYQFTLGVRTASPTTAGPGDREPTTRPVPDEAVAVSVRASVGPGRSRRSLRAARSWALAATIAVLAATSIWWFEYRPRVVTPADPLADYAFTKLTEFEGAEEHAAISRDGRFVAFLRERDGTWDAWVGQIGTGAFRSLTEGTLGELRNPAVRTLGFLPDATQVVVWARSAGDGGKVDAGLAFPTMGGPPQAYRKGIAELDWSPDAGRIVYHTAAAGDPLFVARSGGWTDGRLIHRADSGIHNHFPVWSHNGAFVYFVRGFVPDEMDLWRIRPEGGEPERLTFHDSRVSFPTPLDDHTLLYLATAEDGSGPWIHALDVDRGSTRRLDTRGQEYTSLAASRDGRRLVATEIHRTASLWRMPLQDGSGREQDARRLELPTPRGESPRFGAGFIVFRAPKAGTDGIWKIADGAATELWSGAEGRAVAAPAVTPDSRKIAFPVRRQGRTRLHVMDVDGGNVRTLAEDLDVRGAPAWSPDGRWIAIGALHGDTPRLFRIPVDGGAPVALGDAFAVDPAWSPSGRFLVHASADIGTNLRVVAVNADGTPRDMPEIVLSRGSSRFQFLSEHELVVLKGNLSQKSLWMVDLRDGRERPLVLVGAGPIIRDFDVAVDRSEVVFDRVSSESDIVLIERQQP